MRKILAFAMLLIALSTSIVGAEEKLLRVGYIPETGFLEENWAGHQQGYGYEYMEFLSNYGGWKFNYVPCDSWEELGNKLNSGEIDLMPEMPGNWRLIPNAKRADHVIGRFSMELILSKKLDGIPKPNMKIGTMISNYPTPSIAKIAANEGFNYELVNFKSFFDMKYALSLNEIDGYIAPMLNPKDDKNIFALFDRQSYRVLVNENNTQLLKELNAAMDQMLIDQPNIRDRLNQKYLVPEGFPLILTGHEREYLANKRRLNVAIINKQRPYAYNEGDELKGAIPDIMKRIANDLNVEINLVQTQSIAETAELLQNGKADFLADSVCDYSWATSFGMSPTQSYIKIDYVPVTRNDSYNKKPRIVACPWRTLYTKSYIEPNFSEENRVYVDTLEEGFRAVSEGHADVIFAPRASVPYLIAATDSYNLQAGADSYFADDLSLGVYSGADPALWHILNKEINHLDAEWLRSLVTANQQEVVHFTPQWFIYHHPIASIGIITLIGFIIGGVFWYRNRMRKKHLEIIQHMAYTDARYDLPNLAWLESEMPSFFNRLKNAPPDEKIYTVVFSMQTNAAIVERYGDKMLVKQLRDMAEQMQNKEWVLYTAAGIDAGHLICICHAKSEDEIATLVNGAIELYSYIETADLTRIWLHMRAGICQLKPDDFSVRLTVERANVACHQPSKSDVCIFNNEMEQDIIFQHKIETTMEKALAAGEFHAWYQPKYDIRTRKIIGAEALVRWISSEMGFMPPGKFIPLFEKNGFVLSIDYELLDQTFKLQKQRLDAGKEVVPISVNQSRLHMTEEGYLDKIRALIDKYGISPKGIIELELTETVFGDFDQADNQKRAADIVEALHDMGFTISVDDFGSGYSSFMLLNYLPMDVMKIDRSLLNAAGGAKRTRDILANVIALGKALNMEIICEGIETPEQEKLLLSLGCYYGQGFLNAKPMPVQDFIEFFEKRNAAVAAGLI